jgi:hypothetical protein
LACHTKPEGRFCGPDIPGTLLEGLFGHWGLALAKAQSLAERQLGLLEMESFQQAADTLACWLGRW